MFPRSRLVANFRWTPQLEALVLQDPPSSPLEGPARVCKRWPSPASLPDTQVGHRMRCVPSTLLMDVGKKDSPPRTKPVLLTILPSRRPPGPNPDSHRGLSTLPPPMPLSSESCWL